jgi:hypothetical protein
VGGTPPLVTISEAGRLTSSAASAGRRSNWPSAQRYSIAILRASARPFRIEFITGMYGVGDAALKIPTVAIAWLRYCKHQMLAMSQLVKRRTFQAIKQA